MRRSRKHFESPTVEEAFEQLTLDDLRPLAALIAPDPPKKKSELVLCLTKVMTNPVRVRSLYEELDPQSQKAVRFAVHDSAGQLDLKKFQAWFGERSR